MKNDDKEEDDVKLKDDQKTTMTKVREKIVYACVYVFVRESVCSKCGRNGMGKAVFCELGRQIEGKDGYSNMCR